MFFDVTAFLDWLMGFDRLEGCFHAGMLGLAVGFGISRFYLDSLAVWLLSRCRERLRRHQQPSS